MAGNLNKLARALARGHAARDRGEAAAAERLYR
jgi:hypothetical protein